MEAVISISKSDLEKALKTWEEKAKAEGWAARTDPERHRDNAEYLFGLLTGNQA
jgi:hypothetical protein